MRGCRWLVFFRWTAPLPTDGKCTTGLSPVIELNNEFSGDIERDWQGNPWGAGAFGRRGRIVLDHWPDPFLVLCAETRFHRCPVQALCLKRSISCRERHGRIHGRFTPVWK